MAKQKFKADPIGSFHIDIAEVRTEQGKLDLLVAAGPAANCSLDCAAARSVHAAA